jgi:hypothetical protein
MVKGALVFWIGWRGEWIGEWLLLGVICFIFPEEQRSGIHMGSVIHHIGRSYHYRRFLERFMKRAVSPGVLDPESGILQDLC